MANFNFNEVILGGRLTADPELSQTPGGVSVLSFSIAVNRKYQKDGKAQTDFFTCQAWKGTAEFISKFFSKGSSICIVGTLQNRNWTDKDGNKRYATEVIVDEANFVDSKDESNNAASTYVPDAYTSTEPKFETLAEDDDLPF